jgi:polyisoprenoid-binding protein YceI
MTDAASTATIPGYAAGTWTIDPVHSEVGFLVRHMMVSKVRGKFTKFEGEIVTAENPLDSSVTATVDLSSIDTGNPDRDNHLRSADFFEVEKHPTMTYRSTGIRRDGEDFLVDGELTLKGVTKPLTLHVELGGFGPDPYGGTRAGFSAIAEIKRSDFGVDFNAVLETGGVVVGDKISLILEIEAVLKS